ncbi:hypothetical protein BCV72DRAFT_311735 [Rhizopus microsporus var. microsporus]|uniref:Uncharacterized protein n=1 Tax=Rhizopus microsporus var. microsporus TaxID=86635 RepID=A0A1X0QZ10_RHIZD|nr:hypothetical protein BCV72DRAFT_311735 [Rhizopus microsporus var. microsporus]
MVYLPLDPNNKEMYEYQQISQKQILTTVWKYSTYFDEKLSFHSSSGAHTRN